MKNRHFFIIRVVIKLISGSLEILLLLKLSIIIKEGKAWGSPSLGKDDIAAVLEPSMQLLKSFKELAHYQNRLTALLQI